MAQPKYLEIQNQLKDEIISGKFKYGDRFYSEAELKDKFNVSSITVIRAVKELVMDGYLVRYQGKGTYVSHSINDTLVTVDENSALDKQESFDNKSNLTEKVNVISVTKDNDPEYLQKLGLRADQSYYVIERIRYAKDQPYINYFTYLPENYVHQDWLKDINSLQNIFVKVKENFDLYLNDEPFKEDISIVQADKKVSQNLLLPENYPVVKQEKRIQIKGTEKTVYYSIAFRRGDHFELSFASPDYRKEN